MYLKALLLPAVLLINETDASFRKGGCPAYTTVDTFDPTLYTGRWFEVVKDKYNFYELHNGCTIADYSLNDDGTIAVHN